MTIEPGFVGSPIRMTYCAPFGRDGASFHCIASGVIVVVFAISCADTEAASTINAATRSTFMMILLGADASHCPCGASRDVAEG